MDAPPSEASKKGRRFSRPSSDDFNLLVQKLNITFEEREFRGGFVPCSALAIRAVLEFLNASAGMLDSGALKTLAQLHVALHNLERGGKPPEIFGYKPPGNVTRPTGLHRDYVRAELAAAMELLMRKGKSRRREAAEWLAKELKKRNYRGEKNSLISSTQIMRWRDEANANTGSLIVAEEYRRLGVWYASHGFNGQNEIQRAKALAIFTIENLRTFEFLESPPEHRNPS